MSVLSVKSNHSVKTSHHLGDFTTDPRVVVISAISVLVASAAVMAGIALLQLIKLATNIAYFGRFSFGDMNCRIRRLASGWCWFRWLARSSLV